MSSQGRQRRLSANSLVDSRKAAWDELDQLLQGKRLEKRAARETSRVAELYRQACTDLMRAERLGCEPEMIAYLDRLVSRAHSALYSGENAPLLRVGQFLRRSFPRALRANRKLFLLASLLFWIPFSVALSRSWVSEEFSGQVLPLDTLERMAEGYQQDISEGRDPGQNAAMAGFYVFNNVGIAFRCFATGILFGLGSAFFLVYNGLVTGAVMGHVLRVGGGENIVTFVSGHAPLELCAIVVSGAAGLQMGQALILTHGKTRLGSLWANREAILIQVLGAAFMLLLAALIEGFWSPSTASHEVKWAVGAAVFLALGLYLTLAGRKLRPEAS